MTDVVLVVVVVVVTVVVVVIVPVQRLGELPPRFVTARLLVVLDGPAAPMTSSTLRALVSSVVASSFFRPDSMNLVFHSPGLAPGSMTITPPLTLNWWQFSLTLFQREVGGGAMGGGAGAGVEGGGFFFWADAGVDGEGFF